MTGTARLTWAILLLGLLPAMQVRADGPPPPPMPDEVAPDAVQFARRDAEKAAELAQAASEQAKQAARKAAAVEAALQQAQTDQTNAAELLEKAAAALTAAEKAQAAADDAADETGQSAKPLDAKSAAEKELAEARQRAKAAAKAAAASAAALVAAIEKAQAAADKAVEKAAEAAKPLIDAKTAAEKDAAAARQRAEAAAARAEQFAQSPPQADPKAIRLVETYKHNRPMMACLFDGYGEFLFAGAQDSGVHRWDVAGGAKIELEGHRSWVRRMAFLPDGETLITGDDSGRLIRWQTAASPPAPEWTIEAHRGFVRAIAVSPDGRLLATSGNDNLVKIWSADDGSLIHELAGHERNVYNVAFHPSGRDLASGDLMGVLKHWDVSTGELLREMQVAELHKYDTTFRADCGGFRGMEFSPGGKYLALAGIGEVTNAFAGVGVPTVVLMDWTTGKRSKLMKPADNFRGTCWSVRFHPSGQYVMGAGGGAGGSLWFWKLDSEKPFFAFKLPQVAYDAAFHPDGLRLAVALYNQTVVLYDLGPKAGVGEK